MPSKRHWRKKPVSEEWTGEGRLSEAELLNRVLLAKALQAYAGGRTFEFRTGKEVLEISPKSARDVMRASGRYPTKTKRTRKH